MFLVVEAGLEPEPRAQSLPVARRALSPSLRHVDPGSARSGAGARNLRGGVGSGGCRAQRQESDALVKNEASRPSGISVEPLTALRNASAALSEVLSSVK